MKFLTRKNLISAAAIFAAFCFTACDDSSSSEPNFPDAPSSSSAAEKIFANEVRYQASTKNMENLEKLGEVQIRYVDENGKLSKKNLMAKKFLIHCRILYSQMNFVFIHRRSTLFPPLKNSGKFLKALMSIHSLTAKNILATTEFAKQKEFQNYSGL